MRGPIRGRCYGRRVRDLESVLAGLNDAQRRAALALRGPVAILAGAGTGKTTTINHRIACQVRSDAFQPSQTLAVTFTDKAAGELRSRLKALGVDGVEARTAYPRPRRRRSRHVSPANRVGRPSSLVPARLDVLPVEGIGDLLERHAPLEHRSDARSPADIGSVAADV
jgi:hypothetical protein